MKTIFQKIIAAAFLVSAIFIIPPGARSQDTSAGAKEKKMKIRIEKDDNGKTTVIDTVINPDNPEAMRGMEELLEKNNIKMKHLDQQMGDLDEQMRGMDDQMRQVEIYMRDFDSTMRDSVMGIAKRFEFRGPREMRMHVHPNEFSYDFDVPEVPEIPDFDAPGAPFPPDVKVFHYRGESLSDVLGDIPMSNVKSYKIKETKNGKRIIIDVDDDAVIRKENKVVIITRPDHPGRPAKPPRPPREHKEIKKDVKIETD